MAALANQKALLKFQLSRGQTWCAAVLMECIGFPEPSICSVRGSTNSKAMAFITGWVQIAERNGQVTLTSKMSSEYWRSIHSPEKGTRAIAPQTKVT